MAIFFIKRKEMVGIAQLKDLIVNGVGRFIGKVYASEFVGKLTGNADTSTKATQDESGNNIKSSYASSISISDHTITLKNKNGTSLGTVTVPDNNTWRGIQDNLTSDSTTDSLSAAQGKALKALVDGKAESSHTHSNYAQNAFSKVYCGGKETFIEASTKNDSLTINPGTNITFMIDPVNKSFTISATDTNTDTKVTNTLAKTTKAYVTGTTSSSTNTGTQVFDTGVYLGAKTGTLYMNDNAYVSGYSVKDAMFDSIRALELNIGDVTINSNSPWSMNITSVLETVSEIPENALIGACLKNCWPHSTWAFACTLLLNGTNLYIATTTTQVYNVSVVIFYKPYA